jgi:phosphate transport system substrate-binding protein
MTRWVRPFASVLVFITCLLSACSPFAPIEPTPLTQTQAVNKTITPILTPIEPTRPGNGSIQINGAGATFPQLIYAEWAYAYAYVDPTVVIDYQGIGSSGGKKAILDGSVDFAGSDSLLTPEEYIAGKDLQMYPMLAGAVVVIYNFKPVKVYPAEFNAPRLVLDRQTLVDIYNGKVRKWIDPKIITLNPQLADYLPDATITVVHRSDGSGTTELFTKSLTSFGPDWTAGASTNIEWPIDKAGNGVAGNGNQGVAAAVINTPNSLGYVELSYAISNSLVYADMVNKAGKIVTANADSLASAIKDFGTANFSNRLTATIVDGGGQGSWPISGYTYLILHTTTMKDCIKAQKLLAYMRWTLTDPSAGDRAAKLGYAVLPGAVRDQVLTEIAKVTCNGHPLMK